MIKKYLKNLYYSYKTWYLATFLGLNNNRIVLFIRKIFDMTKRIIFPTWGRILDHKTFQSNWYILHFIIEREYLGWISGLRKYITEHPINNLSTDKTIYVGSSYKRIKQYIGQIDTVLDLSDSSSINEELYARTTIYIKRESKKDELMKRDKLRPLPYLFSSTYYKTQDILNTWESKDPKETYYMSFGGSTDNGRKELLDEIDSKIWKRLHVYQTWNIEHIRNIDNSKYALNLHGAWEYCHRFTEIAMSNALMLCQKYTIYIPNDFTDMENIVYFETTDELVQKISHLDNDNKEYHRIMENFKSHYQQHHTHNRYCENVLALILW